MRGLGRYYQIHVLCRGQADPVTGYFLSIKHIDQAVHKHALPYLQQLITTTPSLATIAVGTLMGRLMKLLSPPLDHTVARVRLDLTPFYNISIRSRDMAHVVIRHQYEFAAAHRLHTPRLSDEENRRVFGKCNNPSGHGHNYRVEVAVRAPIGPNGQVTPVEDLDRVVDEAVIEKLDHKHLNLDVPQFDRLNPSVEHIAMVIHSMLTPALGAIGVTLEEVSVWETEKTVCTYRADTVKTGTAT